MLVVGSGFVLVFFTLEVDFVNSAHIVFKAALFFFIANVALAPPNLLHIFEQFSLRFPLQVEFAEHGILWDGPITRLISLLLILAWHL